VTLESSISGSTACIAGDISDFSITENDVERLQLRWSRSLKSQTVVIW